MERILNRELRWVGKILRETIPAAITMAVLFAILVGVFSLSALPYLPK